MKIISYLLLSFLLLSQVVIASNETESEAERILKTSVNNVFAVLSNKLLSTDQKKSNVIEITDSVFDYSLIAKFTLGKTYWNQLDVKQRAEFTTLFMEWYQNTFIGKIDLFSDEKVIFKPSVVKNEKNVRIPTVLLSKGEEHSILYMMFKTQNGWKICDIVIDGISQLRSNQSQFQNAIKDKGIDGLLTQMRKN